MDFSPDSHHHRPRGRDNKTLMGFQLTRSTASLDCKPQIQLQSQRRRSSKFDSAIEHLHKSRRSSQGLQSLEFDSEPTYYRMQDTQSRASEHTEIIYPSEEMKKRPAPPKKPLRLSLHRAASLQSIESAPPAAPEPSRKPTKRNHRGDPPLDKNGRCEINIEANGYTNDHQPPQPPPRTPSRAESCQSALRWPSPKPRPHLASISMDKWC